MKNSAFSINALTAFLAVSVSILLPSVIAAQPDEPVIVNMDNFARAETAAQFDRILGYSGGINQWFHIRRPTPLDQQCEYELTMELYRPPVSAPRGNTRRDLDFSRSRARPVKSCGISH